MSEKFYLKNILLECASTTLHCAGRFRHKDRGAELEDNFKEQIITSFDQFERMTFERQIPATQVQQAKYALAAFLDELVLSSSWPGRNQWMGTPLQLEFFGEHLAGEGFFKRLNELRQNPQENIQVLEVYYVCLQLGFEGMYRLRGLEQLLALQVDLRSQIEMIRGTIDPKLSPEGLAKQSVVTKVGLHLPYWVIASVTAALIFFIYFGFAMVINHQANNSLANINVEKNIFMRELVSFQNI